MFLDKYKFIPSLLDPCNSVGFYMKIVMQTFINTLLDPCNSVGFYMVKITSLSGTPSSPNHP